MDTFFFDISCNRNARFNMLHGIGICPDFVPLILFNKP
nr:MAG TPA: hypothetical protein [Caudoviricetes sp.]